MLFGPASLTSGLLGATRGTRTQSLRLWGPWGAAVPRWCRGRVGEKQAWDQKSQTPAPALPSMPKHPPNCLLANHTGGNTVPSVPRSCKGACPKGWALPPRQDTPIQPWRIPPLSQLRPPVQARRRKEKQGSQRQERLKGLTLRCLPHLTNRVTHARPSTPASTGTADSIHQASGHSTSFLCFLQHLLFVPCLQ